MLKKSGIKTKVPTRLSSMKLTADFIRNNFSEMSKVKSRLQ